VSLFSKELKFPISCLRILQTYTFKLEVSSILLGIFCYKNNLI